MAINFSNNYIANLISAGADAMTNLYEVEFYPPTSVSEAVRNQLKIRTKSFTPPSPSQKKYDVHWKTVSIPKLAPKIELDRSLEFEFRIDAHYDVLMAILEWQSISSVASLGYAANSPESFGKIIVRALATPITNIDSEGATADGIADENALVWQFEDVAVENVNIAQYSTEDANPGSVTCKFIYGKYIDPQGALF